MKDHGDRKFTFNEKLGMFAAFIMFNSIGMIMGGNSAGNLPLVWSGAGIFLLGSLISLYLIREGDKAEKAKKEKEKQS